jgi:hypothetical protein
MKLHITQTSKFKVWSPAQLISWENLEPRPNMDIGCSQNCHFFLTVSQHFIKIIFEYTFRKQDYFKRICNEALYNSNFKVQSLVSSPAHQLGELGTQVYTDI